MKRGATAALEEVPMMIHFTLEVLAKLETRGSLAEDGAVSAGNGGGMQVAGEAAAEADLAATPGEIPAQAVKRTMANFASGLHVPPRKPAPLNIVLRHVLVGMGTGEPGPIPETAPLFNQPRPASFRGLQIAPESALHREAEASETAW
jgi:hypothetical protein